MNMKLIYALNEGEKVMTKDAWVSLLVKILLMVLTPLAAKLHMDDGATLTAFSTDIADLVVLGYGVYSHYGMNKVAAVTKVLLIAFLLSAFLVPSAFAADIAVKAINNALSAGYPSTRCGIYYGIGTGGNAGSVNGAAVGTQIVQGDIDAIVGYTCPFATNAFWFAEGSFGFSNLNGSSNGLALSGPLVAIERVGAGSPINALLGGLLPSNLNPALPSIPLLPAGVTTSTGSGYLFAGLVEQDIGAQVLTGSGHQWVVAPLLGVGLLTRASNNVMIDTWAGWQMNSNSFCPGGGNICAKLGNMARVGVSLKY